MSKKYEYDAKILLNISASLPFSIEIETFSKGSANPQDVACTVNLLTFPFPF